MMLHRRDREAGDKQPSPASARPLHPYRDSMTNMGWRLGWVAAFVCASSHAGAQTPPKVWTQFDTAADHVNVAGIVCGLGATATLDGRVYAIALDAFED